MKRILDLIIILALSPSLFGCSTAQRRAVGAAIGGEAGATISRTASGGNYMDKQANELARDLPSVKIERIGDGIRLTLDSNLHFAMETASLLPEGKSNLDMLAPILNKYVDTNILIEAHTDGAGPEDGNLESTKKLAAEVANYLANLAVSASRLETKGCGASEPVATNDTEIGRRQNRRIEITIKANDRLQDAARQKDAKH